MDILVICLIFCYLGPRELPNPLLHYEVPRENIRRESFSRVSRASSYEKMSDDSSLPPDLNLSQDKKLYGRFRNLFIKLSKKEREISPIPFSIDLQKLIPNEAAVTGVLNVRFYISNDPQAFWGILISTKLFLYENYEKISFGSPNHTLNMLDFKFQKGPPSESKFKLLHNQNSIDNIQFESSANQTWSKSLLTITDAFNERDDIEDEDDVAPVYDVPSRHPSTIPFVITQDNEMAIYDVPSKKPRVVETQTSTPPQQEIDDTYDVPSKNPRPVQSESTPPEQRPEDMYDVPSNKLRPVKPQDGTPLEEPDDDTYDVPSNRPVIPPRPNFSYGSVYSDLASPPHSPTFNQPKEPISDKFVHPPVLPMARRAIPHVQSSNPEITNIESTNPISVEGFLKLLTDGNVWIKFFFILRDRFLQAFDDVTKLTAPVLVIDIFGSEYSFIPPDESKRKFSFSLCSSSLSFNPILRTSRFSFQNVFVFATDSFRDFKTWRNAIFEMQGVFNISKKSSSFDQLSSFDEIPYPKKARPIRRVFSSVRKREQTYDEVDQRFFEQNHVYVTKPKSKSISLPVTSRNSEKIYSRVFETNFGKKSANAILNGFLYIFSGIEWIKHWFELRNRFLTCFEYQDSIRTIFEIDLSKSEITEASKETNRDFSFKLTNKPGDIVYFFCADTEQVYTEWITALILISVKKISTTSPNAPSIAAPDSQDNSQTSLLNGGLANECVIKSPPQLKGHLLKRTSNGKWEQRYCIVKDGVMLIYRSNQTTPLQRVLLTESLVNVCNSLEVLQNHAFEIRVLNSTDLHFFAAFSQPKLEEWLLGLRNASAPKSPLGLTSSNSSQEKFDVSLESSLNKFTPDINKISRPPKPTRTESIRGVNTQLDDKLPASHLGNPTKVGMLNYRSVSSKIWGRRHCIIHDLCLYIYLHPSSEHPQKVFALPGCEIKSSLHETSKYLSFSIEHRTMKAYLSTQSLQDLQSWVDVLTKIANSTLHGNDSSLEMPHNLTEVPHFKLQTSTPNQNGKSDSHVEQIHTLIYQSNKDVFDTYFHSNRASKNLLNSIESIQKKRTNLQTHLMRLKQSKQKDPEKVKKIRELLLKYDEAILEFRSTLESNKTETSSTIAFLEIQLDNSLSGLRSLTLSNSELSMSNGIRGISNTLESETLI